jgi:hypothetical protein
MAEPYGLDAWYHYHLSIHVGYQLLKTLRVFSIE